MNENFTDRKYRDIALTAAKQLGYGNAQHYGANIKFARPTTHMSVSIL